MDLEVEWAVLMCIVITCMLSLNLHLHSLLHVLNHYGKFT